MNDDDPLEQLKELAAAPIKETKRKYRRRAKPIAPPKLKLVEEFPGLTVWNCCDTCGPKCVITAAGTGLCAHPGKAALQQPDMLNRTVLAKYQRAKAELQKQMVEQKLKKAGGI